METISRFTLENSQINFTPLFINDEINLKSKYKLDLENIIKNNSSFQIIPNKLKSLDDYLFFSYCVFTAPTLEDISNEFNLLILNLKLNQYFSITQNDLEIKLPNINFGNTIGFKYFSNFYLPIFEDEVSLVVFLVVYNHVFIIKLQKFNEDSLMEENKKFEVLFKREFFNYNILMFLGCDKLSQNKFRFFILCKPGQKLLIFNCKRKKNKIKINFEEKNVFENSKDKNNKIQKFNIIKAIVSNNSDIFFYDKISEKIYSFNKSKNRILCLEELNKNCIKNFLIISKQKDFSIENINDNCVYLITDEIIENKLIINLWKIKNKNYDNKTSTNIKNELDFIECQKIQSFTIKSNEETLGSYNLSFIDDNNISICFYESDEIFIINLKNDISDVNIKNIYELIFPGLFAILFDYNVDKNGKLILTLYDDEEFIKYEIDLINAEKIKEVKIKYENLIVNVNKKEQNDENDEREDENEENLEKGEDNEIKLENSNSNSNSDKIIENKIEISVLSLKNEEDSIPNNTNNTKNEDKVIVDKNNIKTKSSFTITDFKNSISDKLILSIEDKLDNLIKSKLNTFGDNLNNKLSDVFSFMKKQTDELEEIRKRNTEAMTNVTNLIIKSQENLKNKNNLNNVNNNNIPNNMYFNMMNYPLYNKNLLMNNNVNNNMNSAYMRQYQQQMQMIYNDNNKTKQLYPNNPNYPYNLNYIYNNQNKNNFMYQNYANGYNPNNGQENIINRSNYYNTNNEKDNKFKEDEIFLELEKKLAEINKSDEINLSLNFANEKDNQNINYSSDISSGNLESDVIIIQDVKKEINNLDTLRNNKTNHSIKIEDNLSKSLSTEDNRNSKITLANDSIHLNISPPNVNKNIDKSHNFNLQLSQQHSTTKKFNCNTKKRRNKRKDKY